MYVWKTDILNTSDCIILLQCIFSDLDIVCKREQSDMRAASSLPPGMFVLPRPLIGSSLSCQTFDWLKSSLKIPVEDCKSGSISSWNEKWLQSTPNEKSAQTLIDSQIMPGYTYISFSNFPEYNALFKIF